MTHDSLLLPAIRAQMGDWTYYTTSMTLEDLAGRVTTASAVHESRALDDMIRRSLGNRASDIAEYLLSDRQRFFGSVVVGVCGGRPEWLEVGINDGARPWREEGDRLDGAIGFLRLSGSERLYALDGRHRVVGTGRALEKEASLGADEITVVFVGHSGDELGIARTRRLFSTLNRYAKPVSRSDIIALDEDDAAAIVTRRLFDSHPLFVDRLSLGKTKAIPVRDLSSVTSIVALYDSMKMVLECSAVWEPKHLRFRPSDETLNVLTEHCVEYWMAVVHETEVLQAYLRAPADGNAAGPYRGSHGGHLFFRPVGMLAHTWAATTLCKKEGLSLRTAVQRLAAVPMELGERPWAGLLWDVENQRMRTAPEAQRVAKWIMYSLAGGTLERVGSSEPKLKAELAGLLNKDPEEVDLLSLTGWLSARHTTAWGGTRDVG